MFNLANPDFRDGLDIGLVIGLAAVPFGRLICMLLRAFWDELKMRLT